WIVYTYGSQHVLLVKGAVGIVFSKIWRNVIYRPRNHPMINEAEFDQISSNGALVELDQEKGKGKEKDASRGPKWDYLR
ncbi:MFS transporter, partial [Pseudomonas syringae pv. tagetis]